MLKTPRFFFSNQQNAISCVLFLAYYKNRIFVKKKQKKNNTTKLFYELVGYFNHLCTCEPETLLNEASAYKSM